MGKTPRIPFLQQEGALRSYFPESNIVRKGDIEIQWTGKVSPTPLSASYTLLLRDKKGEVPKVYVLEPKPLPLAAGQNVLPHVYSTSEQQLCLYYPKYQEWKPSMYYVHTLIPWASEWLLHYEVWVSTGDWKGGGIEHEVEK